MSPPFRFTEPLTVMPAVFAIVNVLLAVKVKVAPELTVMERQELVALKVIVPPESITSSEAVGTPLGDQVPEVFQFPVALAVLVAACTVVLDTRKNANKIRIIGAILIPDLILSI
jgi:hypothetical protein